MWTISLPLRVPVSKKKYFSLNLNQYRNAHFQTLSKAKNNFQDRVGKKIKHLPTLERCSLEYVLYPETRQLCDVSNICSIVDKFFSDTLVICKKIPDDNYLVMPEAVYRFGSIDKHNPRVDVIIRSPQFPSTVPPEPIQEAQKEEIVMQIKTVITLTKTDMAKILRSALAENVAIPEDAEISVASFDTMGKVEITIEAGQAPVTTPLAEVISTTKDSVKAKATRTPKATPVKEVIEEKAEEPAAEVAEAQETASEVVEEPKKAATPSIFGGPLPTTPANTVAQPATEAAPKKPGLFDGLTRVSNA